MQRNPNNQRRVVISGLGVVAPNGQDLDTFWKTLRDGVSAAAPVSRFAVDQYPTKICCELRGFDPSRYMEPKKARRLDSSILYGIAAARLAAGDAKVDFSKLDPDRIGLIEGSSLGGMGSTLRGYSLFLEKGYKSISPFHLVNSYFGGGSGEIAMELGIKGLALTYSSGSASGSDVLGYAMRMIQDDEVDVMVAGGSEAPLVEGVWGGFCQTRVMTRHNEDPAKAMRPFDRSRDGFLLGEGAAFLVLEELSHALGRRAKIYAEVAGHGRSCEAYHSVAPHPEALGLCRAMEKAMRHARMHWSEIQYINAHGTATESNDRAEITGIRKCFGAHARRLAISSTKPVTGHLFGAAGALEAAVCALAIDHQVIPPTLNLHEPETDGELDFVPNQPRPYPITAAMNVSVGFGGKNACLILRRFTG
jgi:3-oxoacyl-[acyl-carrier-protein] synthase II